MVFSPALNLFMAKPLLPVVSAIDSSYALPLLVMLNSLREQLSSSAYRPVLYLMHRGLSPEVIESISKIVETHSLAAGAETLARLPRTNRFPPEAAYPLVLPELLPQHLDRVLFLDADTLVLDDLTKLWESPLGDHPMGAAQDTAIPYCGSPRGVKQEAAGIPGDAVYVNCGVLLIDLPLWRKRDVTRRAFDYLARAGSQVDLIHQEALNAVLWDDCAHLDRRWNVLAGLAGRIAEETPEPGIVHFAGRFKPWRAPTGGPFYERYLPFLSRALEVVPPARRSIRDCLLSCYDRHLRTLLYPLERELWKRRLI